MQVIIIIWMLLHVHACMLINFYYRLKLFHKRFVPRPLLLNNSDIFQLGSPSKSSFSTLHDSISEQNDSIHISKDDSIPPLPPPMPPLSEVIKGLHPPRKRMKVSNSFYDGQKSFDENVLSDSFYENYHFQKSFDYGLDQIPVISNAEDDQNIVEGFATSSPIQPAGFIPDFAADISSISNDSKLVAPDFAQNSLLQNVQCPVPLHTNGNSSPLIGVATCDGSLRLNGGVHVPRRSSSLERQNVNIKKPKRRKKTGWLHGHRVCL